MAEWWEADEIVSDDAEWWAGDEIVDGEEEPGEAPEAKPRDLLGVLTDAFSRETVEKSPEAVSNRDEVAETRAAMEGLEQRAPGVYRIRDPRMGALETVLSVGTAMVAEPLAGLAGLVGAALPGEPGQGAEVAESTREALTYEPRTEAGQEMLGELGTFLAPVGEAFGAAETGLGKATMEATGSPELATVAHAVPTALAEVLGLGILKKPSMIAESAARAQERVKIKPDASAEEIAKELTPPEAKTYDEIAQDLRAKRSEAVAEEVRPDYEIMQAAEELGVDLNPSAYSTNEAYKRVEQALKSQPGSDLAAREAEAIQLLGQRADELIADFRGEVDKSILDERVRGRFEGTIKDLDQKAENLYRQIYEPGKKKVKVDGEVREVPTGIPQNVRVKTRASEAYINARLEELGGDVTGLSSAERALHKVLNQDKAPTYARLDQLRKDVGQGFKRRGVYGDDLSGNLDQVYSALITDQAGVAKAFGVGEEFAAARKLVQTRKELEKRSMALFGKELNQSIIPKLAAAATSLTKGDVSRFKNLMKALPEDMRSRAAATMLNDLFTLGARQKGSIGQGFANAYQGLQRNPGAKAELFKYLPAEAQRRFDAIGKVSTGIFRAKALENTSRTARDILQTLESAGWLEKIYGKARPVAYMTGGALFGMAADATSAAVKGGAKRVQKADDLLSSPSFSRAIAKAMEGKVKEAETMLRKSKVWKAFRETLGEGTKAQLAAVGPIAWLTQQEEPAPPVQPEDQISPAPQPGQPAGLPPVGPPPEVFGGQ